MDAVRPIPWQGKVERPDYGCEVPGPWGLGLQQPRIEQSTQRVTRQDRMNKSAADNERRNRLLIDPYFCLAVLGMPGLDPDTGKRSSHSPIP